MRRGFQSLALERDHALIAVHVAARIDGEGQMPMAEQVAASLEARSRRALSNRASARKFDGASKSTSSMVTGPSLLVCN